MPVTRVIDHVGDLIRTELEKQALEGEDITWDATVLPGDGKAPILFLTVALPGPLLGTKVQVGVFAENPAFIGEAEVSDAVRTLLEVVRQQQTQQLQNPPAMPPGAPPPSGGVLLG